MAAVAPGTEAVSHPNLLSHILPPCPCRRSPHLPSSPFPAPVLMFRVLLFFPPVTCVSSPRLTSASSIPVAHVSSVFRMRWQFTRTRRCEETGRALSLITGTYHVYFNFSNLYMPRSISCVFCHFPSVILVDCIVLIFIPSCANLRLDYRMPQGARCANSVPRISEISRLMFSEWKNQIGNIIQPERTRSLRGIPRAFWVWSKLGKSSFVPGKTALSAPPL